MGYNQLRAKYISIYGYKQWRRFHRRMNLISTVMFIPIILLVYLYLPFLKDMSNWLDYLYFFITICVLAVMDNWIHRILIVKVLTKRLSSYF